MKVVAALLLLAFCGLAFAHEERLQVIPAIKNNHRHNSTTRGFLTE